MIYYGALIYLSMISSNSGETLSSVSSNSDRDSTQKTRHKHSLEYKFNVLQQWEQSHLTIYQFCKIHSNINRRNLRRWILNKETIRDLYMGFSPTLTRFRTSRFDIIETPLYAWVMDVIHRNNPFPISRSTIVQKAKRLYKKAVFLRMGKDVEDDSSSSSVSLLELSEEVYDTTDPEQSSSSEMDEVIPNSITEQQPLSAPPDTIKNTALQLPYSGISNPGSLCYAISVIQQLFMHRQLCETILCWDEASEQQSNNQNDKQDEIAAIVSSWAALKSVLLQLDPIRNQNSSVSFTLFRHLFKTPLGTPLDVNVQEDAEEFLSRLFYIMQERIHYTIAPDFIDLFFATEIRNSIICPHGHISSTCDCSLHLSIDMDCDCLEDAFRKLTQLQPLTYRCDRCQSGQSTESYKLTSFEALPNTIILHLKRFGIKGKNNKLFSFPIRDCLNLSNNMTKTINNYLQSIASAFQKTEHRHTYLRDSVFIYTKRKRREQQGCGYKWVYRAAYRDS